MVVKEVKVNNALTSYRNDGHDGLDGSREYRQTETW
jgi:hypothetical protein